MLIVLYYWYKWPKDELCKGTKASELMLRYTLLHPYRHTTRVGPKNQHHLSHDLEVSAKGPLPEDLYDQVRERITNALAENG